MLSITSYANPQNFELAVIRNKPNHNNTCAILVSWVPPNTTLDGTVFIPAEYLEKFTLYSNRNQDPTRLNTLTLVIDITDPAATSFEFNQVPKGNHYFYMTATSIYGYVSPYSNVVRVKC
jgi:hypothetical protein